MYIDRYRHQLIGHKCKCGRRFRENDLHVSKVRFLTVGFHLRDLAGRHLLWAVCSNPSCQHKVSLKALGIKDPAENDSGPGNVFARRERMLRELRQINQGVVIHPPQHF